MKNKKVTAYTDGSAVIKSGLGGSACVFVEGDKVTKVINKGLKNTKTGRAEIHAFLIALKEPPKTAFLSVYSDSKYVINTIELGWLENWKMDGFSGKKNKDLWLQVDEQLKMFKNAGGKVRLFHVKGHNGDIYNELADEFASYKNFTEEERVDDGCI